MLFGTYVKKEKVFKAIEDRIEMCKTLKARSYEDQMDAIMSRNDEAARKLARDIEFFSDHILMCESMLEQMKNEL